LAIAIFLVTIIRRVFFIAYWEDNKMARISLGMLAILAVSLILVEPSFPTPLAEPPFAVLTMSDGRQLLPQILIRLIQADNWPIIQGRLATWGLFPLGRQSFTTQEYLIGFGQAQPDCGRVTNIARQLGQWPELEWAEPNFVVGAEYPEFRPNDPYFSNEWHLDNSGQLGAALDADIDGPEGWAWADGAGMVIAIVDQGIDLAHEDLLFWNNPGESGDGRENNGLDDDGNGYIDDYRGWDFAGDYQNVIGGESNDPNPRYSGENHGTVVSGIAGAVGNNGVGIAGSALNAKILPIRTGDMPCSAWGNALRYAARYGDVVNNSWAIDGCENEIDAAIADAVAGRIVGAKRGALGTPVLFSSGNKAAGWKKYTITISPPGEYTLGWFYTKNASVSIAPDTVWLDDITWPGEPVENFEAEASGSLPTGFTASGNGDWRVVDSDGIHIRGAGGKAVRASPIGDSAEAGLTITRTLNAGSLTFWVWVACEYSNDFFSFRQWTGTDWKVLAKYSPGQYGAYQDSVGYPANQPDVIAVGASDDGAWSGFEERIYYSQYGPELWVVAPGGGARQGIYATDRMGSLGYSTSSNYISGFNGTSASSPVVAGIVADMLAYNPTLSAAEVKTFLAAGADKIGFYDYPSGRNDFYGVGRVNLAASLKAIRDRCGADGDSCDDGNWCRVGDHCFHGNCLTQARDCSGLDNECGRGICDESADQCQIDAQNIGQICQNGAGLCFSTGRCQTLVVDFSAQSTGNCVPLTVSFHDTTQITPLPPAGDYLMSWEWDFGDGGKSYLQNPEHVYTTVGRFSVSLRVTVQVGEGKIEQQTLKTDLIAADGYPDDHDCDGAPTGTDCNDSDPTVYPRAPGEVTGDGIDTNCNGLEACAIEPRQATAQSWLTLGLLLIPGGGLILLRRFRLV
jgi:hypothetical protein